MPRRIDLGRAVLVAGAALLLVSLFLKWYDTGQTGWQVFESLDLVLAALALAAVAAALNSESWPRWAPWAVPFAALVIVVVQLVDNPPAAGHANPSTGAWLALAGTALMTAGGALSLSSISVTVQVRERELRRRVPAVDRRGGRDDARDEPPPRGESLLRRDEARDEPPPRRRDSLLRRDEPEAAVPPDPDALDRTQPLSALPDDPPAPTRDRKDPERS
jgi:hypothetical protein